MICIEYITNYYLSNDIYIYEQYHLSINKQHLESTNNIKYTDLELID